MFFIYLLLFLFLWGVLRLVMLWWRLRQVFRAARFTQDDRSRSQNPPHDRQDERAGVHGGSQTDAHGKKKVIADDEGEYVEFEEVR